MPKKNCLPNFVRNLPFVQIPQCIESRNSYYYFPMIYGYIRVSSDKQTVENQRFEINNFCARQNMKVDGWIEETISGTKSYSKMQLGKLLDQVQKDDLIICAEL